MIQEIRIENFKSVQKLKLPLGRFNVLIGENGCGKSNILEAIAMGVAAASDKLDNEFLTNRGIRVTESRLMRSGFNNNFLEYSIVIGFYSADENIYYHCNLQNLNEPFSSWLDIQKKDEEKIITKIIDYYSANPNSEISDEDKQEIEKFTNVNDFEVIFQIAKGDKEKIRKIFKGMINTFQSISKDDLKIKDFLIFSPENSILRQFEDETQIEPLGVNGKGLFKLLTVIAQEKPEQFEKIKACLKEMFDWFEDFEIPKDLVFTEKRLSLKDRYLPDIQYISQRSANEGFLFVLFYVTLFVSDYTPSFFAIDNIDSALNPKLCRKLITVLTRLAREHNKQVILTTHNPAVLDGLDLNDEEQKLMVVWRNVEGHTKIKNVEPIPTPEGKIPMRMSEAFMNGFIGGLPKNF